VILSLFIKFFNITFINELMIDKLRHINIYISCQEEKERIELNINIY